MPDLPGLPNLSQRHYDRIVAAFPGATPTEKLATYRRWLTNRLIDRVQAVEAAQIALESKAMWDAAHADLEASLPPRPEDPPPL